MLAAIAAAAIASGAVAALPDVGAAAGALVDAVVTAIATATAFGVVAGVLPCCAAVAGSAVVAPAFLSEAGLSDDLVSSDFEPLELERDCGAAALALASALALALEACWAAAFGAAELVPVEGAADAVLRDAELSGAACASLPDGCGAGGGCCTAGVGCCGAGAGSLAAAAWMLLSTSAPKLSLACCDGSGQAGLGAAVWNETLFAVSDVTLYTGRGLSQ